MKQIDWYFDYVSPFAYLQWMHQLPELDDVLITYKPVLFAGLLKHWGHKGPAEIASKKKFTFRHCYWLAQEWGVNFQMPVAHPFNPLPLLRLTIAHSNAPVTIARLFEFVWQQGHIPADEEAWSQLISELDIGDEEISRQSVKDALRENGEQALDLGVFGVPTLVVEGEIFWGIDGFEFFRSYLSDTAVIDNPVVRKMDETPSGV